MTTIKVDAVVRDRLNAEARRRGLTAGSFVEELLESWARDQRFAAMREAMASTAPADEASYAEETASFDALADDAVPDERPSRPPTP